MVLLNLSKRGLDRLMDLCYSYSRTWLFDYNPVKYSVIVFNEIKRQFKFSNRKWLIGNSTIQESENYTHLGINCNKYLSNSDSVQEFALKLRGSFMNLFNIGVNSKCLHPFTCKKLYNSSVIPRGGGGYLGVKCCLHYPIRTY